MSRNPFNLWNPVCESEICDVAFSAFAKHRTECDEIVDMILHTGGTSFELDDDFDESDLEYIKSQLQKHGIDANLTLE